MSVTNSIASMPGGVLWGVIGVLCLSVVFYFTRVPAHRAIRSLTRVQ